MNYPKAATLGIRFFALSYILTGRYDVIHATYELQTAHHFDLQNDIVYICFRFFIALLMIRLSLPLGRLFCKGLEEPAA
jgi:hypothetical protein